jgi:hypothetical protein
MVIDPESIAWISKGDPAWWYPATATGPARPNVGRIAADTGIPLKTLYPALSGRPPENETLTALALYAAGRRRITVESAFARIVKVRLPAEGLVAA